jgi:hypothetical protein
MNNKIKQIFFLLKLDKIADSTQFNNDSQSSNHVRMVYTMVDLINYGRLEVDI